MNELSTKEYQKCLQIAEDFCKWLADESTKIGMDESELQGIIKELLK